MRLFKATRDLLGGIALRSLWRREVSRSGQRFRLQHMLVPPSSTPSCSQLALTYSKPAPPQAKLHWQPICLVPLPAWHLLAFAPAAACFRPAGLLAQCWTLWYASVPCGTPSCHKDRIGQSSCHFLASLAICWEAQSYWNSPMPKKRGQCDLYCIPWGNIEI